MNTYADMPSKLVFVSRLLLILGIALAKVKVCVCYCQSFPFEPQTIFFKCSIAIIIVCSFGIVLSYACITIEASHISLISMIQAVTSISADLILIITASHTIIGLQKPRKEKLITIIKLSIFQSTTVPATIRLGILIRGGQKPDTAFVITPELVFLIIDAALAIVCGSLDIFYQLVKHLEAKFIHKQPALTNCNTDLARDMALRQSEIETGTTDSGSGTLAYHPSTEALVELSDGGSAISRIKDFVKVIKVFKIW